MVLPPVSQVMEQSQLPGGKANSEAWPSLLLRGLPKPEAEPLKAPPSCLLVKGASIMGRPAIVDSMFAVPAHRTAVLQGHTAPVSALAFTRRGRHLASGGLDHAVRIWRLDDHDTRQETSFIDDRIGEILALAFTRSGRELLVSGAGRGGRIWYWDWHADQHDGMRALPGSVGATVLAVSPDGKTIAATERNQVLVWTQTADEFRGPVRLCGRGAAFSALAFSADGQHLFAADVRGEMTSWRDGWRGFRSAETFTAHSGPIDSIIASDDGRLLASVGTDNRVRLWSLVGGTDLAMEIRVRAPGVIRRLQFGSSSETILTASDGGQIARWHTRNGEREIEWRVNQLVCSCLALADHGGTIALRGQTARSACINSPWRGRRPTAASPTASIWKIPRKSDAGLLVPLSACISPRTFHERDFAIRKRTAESPRTPRFHHDRTQVLPDLR